MGRRLWSIAHADHRLDAHTGEPAQLPDQPFYLFATLTDVEEIKGGYQVTVAAVIEREGGDKPVCIAEPVFRYYGG